MGNTNSDLGGSGSGHDVVKNYRSVDYRDEFLWKVTVVGDTGSGKTAICKRLVNDLFNITYKPTEHVDFFLKQLRWDRNTYLRLQLWDVAGTERYGQRTRMFYQGALGAIVVLDVTKQSSLKEAAMWASDINSKVTLGKDIKFPTILLANKVDLLDPAKKTKVMEKLDLLARRNGFLGWWMTSAKDAYNIERPFLVLLEKIFLLSERCPLVLGTKIIPRNENEYDTTPAQLVEQVDVS